MASYPSSLYTQTDVVGTTLVATDDHAIRHNNIGAEIVAIETTIGTNSGTNIFKNFTAGKLAVYTPGGTYVSGVISTATIGTSTFQGGTVNGAVVGTPTILGPINASGTVTPLTMGAALAPTTGGTITDGAGSTFTINAQSDQVFYTAMATAAGNRTIATPLNPKAWQTLNLAFKSSGSANGTLIWGTAFGTTVSSPSALGTGTSWSYYSFRYNPVSTKWDFQGNSISVGI